MSKKIFELRYIFGLKLKELRLKRGITYQELSKESGLSVSYLSEIESGKKYPKGDKISQLSDALGVSYDELVSLKIPGKLQPIVDVIESDFLNNFPLQEFGLNPQKVIEVVSQDPDKINAFIQTIQQISQSYELTSSKFFMAALRSYQEQQECFFEDLEESVEHVHLEFTELADIPFSPREVEQILLQIGVRTDNLILAKHPPLKDLRSLYDPKQRLLMINSGLTKGQQNFMLGREIAFQWLRLKNRPLGTPSFGSFTFEEALNSYRASYFSAALLMPRAEVLDDIREFAQLKKWDATDFMERANRYEATPEMVMQRLTNLLPTYFGLKNVRFMRMLQTVGNYYVTKELHLSNHKNQQGNEGNEHYCRRWSGIRSVKTLEADPGSQYNVWAQVSRYHGKKEEYFSITIAYPNVSNAEESISVSVEFMINKSLEKQVSFLRGDSSVPREEVNITCERCPIKDCAERVAEPNILMRESAEAQMQDTINEILSSN
jgi:transcriptional regulator with XRE-family HTH domain/Zn-dependent peptidase ImmA (M78 family)